MRILLQGLGQIVNAQKYPPPFLYMTSLLCPVPTSCSLTATPCPSSLVVDRSGEQVGKDCVRVVRKGGRAPVLRLASCADR